jgi:drug/metabolite transporter (DMT)-like permease
MTRSAGTLEATIRDRRIGLAFALLTALVSGVSVFVNASAVRAFEDPVLFTTLKNAVAAATLAALAIVTVREPWRPSRGSLAGLVAIGVIGGGVPFILFFTGLAEATAPAAAVIHKTLFLWVAVLAVVFLRERLGPIQVAALALLLLSQLLIQNPTGVGWGAGETLIAIATAFWAVEVIVAKRVLVGTPPAIAAAARMGIGLLVLVGFTGATGGLSGLGSLTAEQLAWVLVTGVLLSAYVGTWYAALRRAPASAVTAVLTLSVPITAGLQLVASGQVPPAGIGIGYGVSLAAVLVFAWAAVDRSRSPRAAADSARGA